MTLSEWCQKWNVPYAAEQELRQAMGTAMQPTVTGGKSESAVQSEVRLAAARLGWQLWRNNVGAVQDAKGNFFRFGLANDSAKMNDHIKSADLVGVRPVLIGPQHIGQTIGQFISYEVKAPGWTYTGTPREEAQRKWAEIVVAAGGHAKFITRKEDL